MNTNNKQRERIRIDGRLSIRQTVIFVLAYPVTELENVHKDRNRSPEQL